MSEIKTKVKKYVLKTYGDLLTVDNPILDVNDEKWIINVKSYYPRIIEDNDSNERIINFLSLDKISTIFYNLSGVMIKSPSRFECHESLMLSLNIWKERIERMITRASSNELSSVKTIRHFLRPIELIVNYIYNYDVLTNEDINNLSRTQRYLQWINLLADINFIEKTTNGYTYGSDWVGLREEYTNRESFLMKLISIVLSERYSYLREIMNLGQLGTVVHTNCCYYKSCVEADKIINRHPKSIWKDFIHTYDKRSYPEIFTTLIELTESDVLHYNKPYFSANEEIFDKIQKMNISKSINPPF